MCEISVMVVTLSSKGLRVGSTNITEYLESNKTEVQAQKEKLVSLGSELTANKKTVERYETKILDLEDELVSSKDETRLHEAKISSLETELALSKGDAQVHEIKISSLETQSIKPWTTVDTVSVKGWRSVVSSSLKYSYLGQNCAMFHLTLVVIATTSRASSPTSASIRWDKTPLKIVNLPFSTGVTAQPLVSALSLEGSPLPFKGRPESVYMLGDQILFVTRAGKCMDWSKGRDGGLSIFGTVHTETVHTHITN